MADLIIKGMEMPKSVWDCPLNTFGICNLATDGYHADCYESRPDWCPLRPAPEREQPITTNADRIRAMSDEELKALFCEVAGDCPQCKFSELGCMALDWLQSPAGGECEQSDADDNRTRDYWEETEDVDKYFS